MDPAGSSPAELSSKLGDTQATYPPTQGQTHQYTPRQDGGKHTPTQVWDRHTKTGGEQMGSLCGEQGQGLPD